MRETATGTKDIEELNTSPAINEERTDPTDEGQEYQWLAYGAVAFLSKQYHMLC